LLLEDERILAISERQLLERHGFHVSLAHSAQEAVETAVTDESIELVLCDIDLGNDEEDGTYAAAQILAQRELPIVFLTGHTEEEYVRRAKAITNYGYVMKDSGEFVLIGNVPSICTLSTKWNDRGGSQATST
jgi:DNA-binding NarL/FixJ family response regulator